MTENTCTAGPYSGTTTGYRYGCHCTRCTHAVTSAAQRRRERGVTLVPVLGTRRRLLSLGAVGYSTRLIARESGLTHATVTRLRRMHDRQPIYQSTADAIRETFDRLSVPPYPHDEYYDRVVRHAIRDGGVPPICWDDEDIDDPDGEPYVYDPPQRRNVDVEDVAQQYHLGFTLEQIADDYGVLPDSVLEALRRHGMKPLARRMYERSGLYRPRESTNGMKESA